MHGLKVLLVTVLAAVIPAHSLPKVLSAFDLDDSALQPSQPANGEAEAAPPGITITFPVSDPEQVSEAISVVSGTTSGTVDTITYNVDAGPEVPCSGNGVFSCDVEVPEIEASYLITVTATGPLGNGTDTVTLEFVTAPTITITSPADDPHTTASDPKTVSGTTANTVDTVTYRIGSGSENPCSTGVNTFSCSVDLSSTGNNTITVTANGPAASATDTVVLNFQPAPTVAITVPASDPSTLGTTPQTVSGTTTNTVDSVTYRIGAGSENSCTVGSGTFSCSVALSSVGNNTITVTANGPAASGTDSTVINYQPPPTITVTVPASDPATSTSSPETVSGTTTNTVNTVTYRIGAGSENACSTGSGTFSCSVTLSTVGNNTITVTANGPLTSATDTQVLDYQPPTTITITVPASDPQAVSGTPATVSGTTTGTVNSVSWSTSEGSGSCTSGSGTFSCSVTSSVGGSKTVTVTADGPTNPDGTDTTVLNFPTFDLQPGTTTPNDLSDSLTVNGTGMTLVFSCTAEDVSGTNIVCRDASTGVTFAEDNTGTAPSVTTLTPFKAFDSNERAVAFNSTGKYYTNANQDLWANGDDVVIEVLYRASTTSNRALLGNATGTGAKGVSITTTSSAATIRVGDGTTNLTQASSSNTGGNTYAHVIAWIDDSTNFGICLNDGTCQTNSNIGTVGDWGGGATEFALGSFGDASNTVATHVIAWRAWKCSACMHGTNNATDMAAIARQRIGVAYGVVPMLVAGSAVPTTLSRGSVAATDVVDGNIRHIYRHGQATPRVVRRTTSGTAYNGILLEPQTTNLALQSQALGTTWTAVTAGDNVIADSHVPPEVPLGATADGVDGDNSSGQHGVTQNITLTATTYSFSVFALAGERTVVALDTGVANTKTYFDLAQCDDCTVGQDCSAAVGTTGSAVIQARAQRFPVDTNGDGTADNEFCRVGISYTGTAASHAHTLLCAESDNDDVYTDSGTAADCTWWQAQVEAFPTFTSTIATTTGSVTRSADDFRFDGASHYTGTPATLDVETRCPSFDVGTSSTFASVGISSTNNATVGINATSDRMQTIGANSGAQWDISASSGDISDGTTHNIRAVMATNDIQGFDGTTSAGTDTSATLPTSASSFLYLGTKGGTAEAPMCPLRRVRLWSVKAAPSVAP